VQLSARAVGRTERRAAVECPVMSPKHSSTGSRGVTVAQLLVEELDWIFRRQPEADFGIDAHIEIVAAGKPTGRLVATQIKGGKSYLKTTTEVGYVFYIDDDHLQYWVNFSLPVIIVLVDVVQRKAYWQHVTTPNVSKAEKRWKIVVPFANELNTSETDALLAIGDVPEPVRRFTELTLARAWMRYLAEGKRLFVEMSEWINKTSGRGDLKLVVRDDDSDTEEHALTWPIMFLGGLSFEQAVRDFFPWADVAEDEETYEEAVSERWVEDNGFWDAEAGEYVYDYTHLAEYLERRREYAHYSDIEPYNDDGEVAKFRLELQLNVIGRGFLSVADYVFDSPIVVRPATPGGVPTTEGTSIKRE